MRRARLLKIFGAALVVWLLERAFEARERSASVGPANSANHLAAWPPPAPAADVVPPAQLPTDSVGNTPPVVPTAATQAELARIPSLLPSPSPPQAAASNMPTEPVDVRSSAIVGPADQMPPPPPPPPPPPAGPSVLKVLPCTDPVAPDRPRVLPCSLVDSSSLTDSLQDSESADHRLGWGTTEEAAAPLVPLPTSTKIDSVNTRRLTSSSVVVLKTGAASSSAMVLAAAKRFAEQLGSATNGELRLTVCAEAECADTFASADTVVLSCEAGEPSVLPPLMQEAYSLVVPPLVSADRSIRLSAHSAVGLVRALATLSQLISHASGANSLGKGDTAAFVPVIEIDDRPAHSWRGLLIDVARHFIPMETVLKLLPLCSAVKINVLHVHLTDDQGWRYESAAHPELNAPASTGGTGDYYSQAEVKQLVSAAHLHGIRVVPELNFPAHTDAAFIAFPWLGSKRIASINPRWGKHDTCAVPGDQTWALLDSIFSELADLFPDEYIHIGGDEADYCSKNVPQWREGGMRSGADFMKKVASIAAKHGKKAVLWDDTMGQPLLGEDGVVVQWWHAPHELSPIVKKVNLLRSHRYYLNENMPAKWSYADPAEGTGPGASVLGGEAALWSEFVDSTNVESRVWPRLGAVAEVLWSPAPQWCEDTLERRLATMADRLHINFGIGGGANSYASTTMTALARQGLGGGDPSSLQCMAELLQPMGHYARFMLKPDRTHTSTQDANTALNNFVDAIAPDNAAGFAFSQAVRNMLHVSAAIVDRRAAFVQLQEQLSVWSKCVDQAKLGHGSDQPLAALLDGVVAKSSNVLRALGQPASATSRSSPSRSLLTQEEWQVLDRMEMRLAILPAAKTLLQYHDNSGTCDKECAIFKGMDIGRGNPHEFQVAATSAADCCWECTERTPDYRGFVYNPESSACYCKQPGPSSSQPITPGSTLLAGATSCCGQLWVAA